MILSFLLRQIVVYSSVIGLSLFIGHRAEPQDYALFNLINAFFGMSYILCDFGFGKSAIRNRILVNYDLLKLASIANLIIGVTFAILTYFVLSSHSKFSDAPIVVCIFVIAASLSMNSFYKMESSQRFDLIGKAEVSQVVIYILSFFAIYWITDSPIISITISSLLRSLSIPLSYYIFSRNIIIEGIDINFTEHIRSQIIKVLGLFADGLQYQASQLLFISKDIVLLYILAYNLSHTQQGFVAMAQTYSLLPILFIAPVSRILLPRFSTKFDEDNSARPVAILSFWLFIASIVFSYLLYMIFPLFNSVVFDGKYTNSFHLVKFLVLANIFTLPSIPIVSFLSVLIGYRYYLIYSIICICITWGTALSFPIHNMEAYIIPMLAGHAVNLLVFVGFQLAPRIKNLGGRYVL